MLRIFISMRTKGLNKEQIIKRRNKIAKEFKNQHEKYKDEIEVIESLFDDYNPEESNPIEFVGRSISAMKDADVVLIPMDCRKSKGCCCELNVAKIYDLPIKFYGIVGNNVVFLDLEFIDTKGELNVQ